VGVLSLEKKQPRYKAVHSLPSSAEVQNDCIYTFTPPYTFMPWKGATLPYIYNTFFRKLNATYK
jgi:hypothetical protein